MQVGWAEIAILSLLSGFTACCKPFHRQVQYICRWNGAIHLAATNHSEFITVAGKRASLSMAGKTGKQRWRVCVTVCDTSTLRRRQRLALITAPDWTQLNWQLSWVELSSKVITSRRAIWSLLCNHGRPKPPKFKFFKPTNLLLKSINQFALSIN